MYFSERTYTYISVKVPQKWLSVASRGVLITLILLFYLSPSLYLLRTDLWAKTLTVGALKGIRVNELMHDVIEKTTLFVQVRVRPEEKIATIGRDTDIYTFTLENRNIFAEDISVTRFVMLFPDTNHVDVLVQEKILPKLIEEKPKVIITGRRSVPGMHFNNFITKYYYLAHEAGIFVGYHEIGINFHDAFGSKVFLRNEEQ